jgi:hypothetical protein
MLGVATQPKATRRASMENWWTRLKKKHWDERTEGFVSTPWLIQPGRKVAPPARKFARWVIKNGWAIVSTLVAIVAAAAALIQALQ